MTSLQPNCSYTLIQDHIRQNGTNKMGGKLDKFLLLMWKNWLLQYRRPLQTVVEIVAPVLFAVLLVVIRSLVDPEHNPPKVYDPFYPFNLSTIIGNNTAGGGETFLGNWSIAYSPSKNEALDRVMRIYGEIFVNVTAFDNAARLEAHFVGDGGLTTFAGLQFDDRLAGNPTIPDDVEVTLRFPSELRIPNFSPLQTPSWKTNLMFPLYQTPGPRSPDAQTGGTPNYYSENFLVLQTVITYTLAIVGHDPSVTTLDHLRSKIAELNVPLVQLKRFPYGSWINDPLLQAMEGFISIIMMLSFVYSCINTVKVITTEKEKQLKEAMKIMGLPNWLHWTAWFTKTFIFFLISIVLMTILLKVSWYKSTDFSVFTYANPLVVLLFLIFYISATITFCFAISVFFSKANTAATVAGLVWFLSYSPYLFLQNQYDQLSLSTKLFASLGSNTAMAYGFQLIVMYEGTSEGIQWENIWRPITPDDNLTLGLIMTMLLFDCIVYLIFALYVEAIYPGEFGVPQPWYFPFSTTFWCNNSKYVRVEDFSSIPSSGGEFFEKEPSELQAGIQIRNLRKEFGSKAAVRNLSLNMYDSQITVLLGHNGAGKTTTMSMLTGMFQPTSGTAIVGGYDITTNMEGVRASLGLCPQHNIIFDDLTVKEHIYFFSKLKGLNKNEIKEEINKYVSLLELEPKADAKSSTLSGGMKRKLCVGMALCGNSKVVMLDEPTAGMDPAARRSLWDLLQKQKEGRTILLSTHFMDEADLLGDRIAIMAGGELQCCGSSFFLKKTYGAGYHLIMDKSSSCDVNEVTNLLRRHIPNIEIHGNIGSELTYLLVENHASVFEGMLQDLEENCQTLGVRSYGISLTTLEEVFMKVGADTGQEEAYNNNEFLTLDSSPSYTQRLRAWIKTKVGSSNIVDMHQNGLQESKVHIQNVTALSGSSLIRNQFVAMFMKKSLSISRSWILLFLQVLMPVAFLIIAMVVSRNAANIGNLPELKINLNTYQNPVTLVENPDDTNEYMKIYQEITQNSRTVQNITSEVIQLTESIPATVRLKYIIGASFETISLLVVDINMFTAWFNGDTYHSAPLALGQCLNAIYKKILGRNFNVRFSNYPLPYTAQTKVQQLLQGNSMGFQLAFNVGFSMAFVSSFYVLFYVRERVSKSKHLQFVSGVKVYIFWLTAFLCDLLTFIITILALIITLAAFQEDGFRTGGDLGRVFVILLYFGVGMIPMMYFASYLFDVPSTGFTRMTLFSVFTGVAAFLVVQVLGTPGLDLEYVGDALHWAFLIVPHYSLSTGIRDVYTTFATKQLCEYFVNTCTENIPNMTPDSCWNMACKANASGLSDYCCDRESQFFKWESPGIGRNLLYSFVFGILLFLLLIAMEYKMFTRMIDNVTNNYGSTSPMEVVNEDNDVSEEKKRIRSHTPEQLQQQYTLVLKDLTKYYKKNLAVNGLCLGVKKFECFGLLGVNGAGKTTTFKMMTGDEKISYGDAWVQSHSIKTQIKEVQKFIGYCPQFDALLDDLTAKESLFMFSLLRGVPWDECEFVAQKLANDFDFIRHLDKQVKELSGGNKRKLSTAISLIGDPPVIYLDEPTTGMDPATKRYLWDAICKVRDRGKCVVLTSHSMEECEALCTRLAIMVNGNFKCLGSTQHLKNKFAQGYTLTIKIKKASSEDEFDSWTEEVQNFIGTNFPNAIQREKHQELLTYYIVDTSVPWSKMFGMLEKGKSRFNIEDYSLGQSSLEQVFLTFTKHQV